jgi:hypothetical protein
MLGVLLCCQITDNLENVPWKYPGMECRMLKYVKKVVIYMPWTVVRGYGTPWELYVPWTRA